MDCLSFEMAFNRSQKQKQQPFATQNSGIRDENEASFFVTFIIKLYRKWGYFITKYDWQAILICILISSLSIVKMRLTKQQNDVSGYSPNGARAREEFRRYQQFFSNDEGFGLATYIFALAKDEGSMLRKEHLKEIVEILDYASTNFTIFNENLNKSENFNEFCVGFCQINEPVKQFYNAFTVQTEQLQSHQPLNPHLVLQYPISTIFGREISLQNNFFGISYSNNTKIKSKSQQISNMNFVKMMGLQFRAQHKNGWKDDDVKKFELEIVDFFENKYASKNLDIYVFSRSYIEKEMVRAGRSIVPWFFVGFLIMCICAVSTVLLRAYYLQQYSNHKITLAIFACILPFLSCTTGLAIMFTAGFRYASILCVIPFLVLAIGIDSSYLMIHEWQRVVEKCRKNPSSDSNKIEFQMSEMLAEVGPAILISTLTNILADSVGAFISSPEIALLCIGNALSIAVAFCFQMTAYAGLMSIIGKRELQREKEEMIKTKVIENTEIHEGVKVRELTIQSSSSSDAVSLPPSFENVLWSYVNFIANRAVASFIIFLYFVYIGFSIYGISKIDVNLSNEKLFRSDSRLLKLSHYRLTYLLPHYTMATVFVNKPGNLSNPSRLQNLNNFVTAMERIPGSWGVNGTKYFIRDFLKYQASFNEELVSTTDSTITTEIEQKNLTLYRKEDLPSFFSWPEYSFWKGFVRMSDDGITLEKFFFTCAYFGKNLGAMSERGRIINEWRDVVDKYGKDFDASVYHEDAIFTDLISNIPTDTWQAVVGAVICIGFICFIFLNNWFAVAIATISVLSICTGILGLMSWWHVDLDPISVAAMIICVGSSCDLPAHTSFHYYLASIREGYRADPKIKLATCLSTIGFPVLQAAVSMILCILALCFVGLYMATVFVKAMLLCVSLCLIHALVIIPAFLVLHDFIRFRPSSLTNDNYPKNVKKINNNKLKNNSVFKTSLPSFINQNKI